MNPAPKPTKERKKRRTKYRTPRQRVEAELERLCKLLVEWRDGVRCVEVELDGCHCKGAPNWGHLIPRGQSAWLKYDLGNSARQCQEHNRLHKYGDPTYAIWHQKKFGHKSLYRLWEVAKAQQNQKRTVAELTEQLSELSRLYEERFAHGTDTLAELVEAGYYGEIIKGVWEKEGRI